MVDLLGWKLLANMQCFEISLMLDYLSQSDGNTHTLLATSGLLLSLI